MDNKKDVAVIILNFKSWQETIQEADICNEFLGIDYENIIIVDNASPNDSYAVSYTHLTLPTTSRV